jgi:electron transport complex, RnfABCDGE type, D subunit
MTLNLSASPHVRDRWTTSFIMHTVLLSLVPAALVGVIVYGWNALLVILASILAAVGTEALFCLACKKPLSITDGSAAVTGMLLALSLSPSTPVVYPVIGSVFAIFVAKCCFGGLGKNFINPALAGRCFLLLSFGKVMTQFPALDGVTSATPLAVLSDAMTNGTPATLNVTSMFLGTSNGVIGSSIIALLIGGLVLWGLDIIHGEICFAVLGSFTVIMGLFGGRGFDPAFLAAQLCGGGVVMGAFFMATDYTTSPVSRLGQLVYGCLIGVLGALFRILGKVDYFSYSVIIGNLFTPLIDIYVVPKPYAYRKKAIRAMSGAKPLPLLQRIPKPVIAMVLITLFAGVALSGVYSMTRPTIEAHEEATKAAAYVAVVPEAVTFEHDEAADAAIAALDGQVYGTKFGKAYVNEAFVAKDASGNTVGYALSVTSGDGYDGNVTLSMGLDATGKVLGIAFTELTETPGMGMLADEPAFKDQFANRSVTQFVHNKGGASGENTIDAISGASTTSGAVVNAVNAGLDFFHTVMGGN